MNSDDREARNEARAEEHDARVVQRIERNLAPLRGLSPDQMPARSPCVSCVASADSNIPGDCAGCEEYK